MSTALSTQPAPPASLCGAAQELLLNCARLELPTELLGQIRGQLGMALDWDSLVRSAWRHGTGSLLYRNLTRVDSQKTIPAAARHQLRQCYVRAAVRNQAHFGALSELLGLFNRAAIPCIVLKGACLAGTLYSDPALRPFADIDLLIRPEFIDRAKTLLLQNHYALAPELTSEALSRKYHSNLPFVKTGDKAVHLELHWQLVDHFAAMPWDHEGLWARSQACEVAATAARTLCAEDAVTYLALHLDKHGYLNRAVAANADPRAFILDELSGNRLIWFVDLHEMLSKTTLDWDALLTRAHDAGLTDALSATFRLLEVLLGTRIAPAVLTRLPAPQVSWPKRLLCPWVLRAVRNSRPGAAHSFFISRLLSTCPGFELRPVRLLDVWDYLFPANRTSARHFFQAARRGAALSVEWTAAALVAKCRKK